MACPLQRPRRAFLSGQVLLQVWREIEGDVDRVFANGKSRVNSAMGMATIRRLLRAYSVHNPAVGYCQGMNFVAGFFLEVRHIKRAVSA